MNVNADTHILLAIFLSFIFLPTLSLFYPHAHILCGFVSSLHAQLTHTHTPNANTNILKYLEKRDKEKERAKDRK